MKVEKVTPDKPEIEAIADSLGLDPDSVFGKLFRVWSWFDDHTVDGNAPCVSKSTIDRRVGVTGFAEAMDRVGWLLETSDGLVLPGFSAHNGETSKQRALTSKRVAAHKSKSNARGNAKVNAVVTDDALPREEKRREEKNKGEPPLNPPTESTPFDAWWESAPRKIGRAASKSAYAAAVKALKARGEAEPHGFLLDRLAAFASTPKARGDFCPYPATWLNQGRYDDDPKTWQDAGGNNGRAAPPPIPLNNAETRRAVAEKAETQRQADATKLAAESAVRDAAEAKHGATLDAMGKGEVRQLAAKYMELGEYDFLTKRITLPVGGMLREACLEFLETESTSS